MWEKKGKTTVRLVDSENKITTGWHRDHMECYKDWKRLLKKLKNKTLVKG